MSGPQLSWRERYGAEPPDGLPDLGSLLDHRSVRHYADRAVDEATVPRAYRRRAEREHEQQPSDVVRGERPGPRAAGGDGEAVRRSGSRSESPVVFRLPRRPPPPAPSRRREGRGGGRARLHGVSADGDDRRRARLGADGVRRRGPQAGRLLPSAPCATIPRGFEGSWTCRTASSGCSGSAWAIPPPRETRRSSLASPRRRSGSARGYDPAPDTEAYDARMRDFYEREGMRGDRTWSARSGPSGRSASPDGARGSQGMARADRHGARVAPVKRRLCVSLPGCIVRSDNVFS